MAADKTLPAGSGIDVLRQATYFQRSWNAPLFLLRHRSRPRSTAVAHQHLGGTCASRSTLGLLTSEFRPTAAIPHYRAAVSAAAAFPTSAGGAPLALVGGWSVRAYEARLLSSLNATNSTWHRVRTSEFGRCTRGCWRWRGVLPSRVGVGGAAGESPRGGAVVGPPPLKGQRYGWRGGRSEPSGLFRRPVLAVGGTTGDCDQGR